MKFNFISAKLAVLTLFLLFAATSHAKVNKKDINLRKNYVVILTTNFGEVKFMLLNETPLHRDNFIKLINEKYYEGLLFHRVVNDFVIQAGDHEKKGAKFKDGNKNDIRVMRDNISAEIVPQFFHYRGAVGAARESANNPEKESSGSQFYIVQATPTLSKMKSAIERAKKRHAVDKKVEMKYFCRGGTPHLDGGYTIFGYVLSGMEIVDEICQTKCSDKDVPAEDVVIEKIEYKKLNRRKIDKKYIHYAK